MSDRLRSPSRRAGNSGSGLAPAPRRKTGGPSARASTTALAGPPRLPSPRSSQAMLGPPPAVPFRGTPQEEVGRSDPASLSSQGSATNSPRSLSFNSRTPSRDVASSPRRPAQTLGRPTDERVSKPRRRPRRTPPLTLQGLREDLQGSLLGRSGRVGLPGPRSSVSLTPKPSPYYARGGSLSHSKVRQGSSI